MMNTGIYEIVNIIDGKRYIGSAKTFAHRFARHKTSLRKEKHHSVKLQRAWNKYGEDSFEFNKLIVCEEKDLIMYEQAIIDYYSASDCGYNIAPIAGTSLGRKHTQESLNKMSASQKLRPSPSDETRKKIGDAHKDKIIPVEMREYLSKINTGKKLSEETKMKISLGGKGLKRPPFTDEHRKNLSEAIKNDKDRIERIRELGFSNKGRKHTNEHRANLSEKYKNDQKNTEMLRDLAKRNIGTKQPPEMIAKRVASTKATKARKKAEKLAAEGAA